MKKWFIKSDNFSLFQLIILNSCKIKNLKILLFLLLFNLSFFLVFSQNTELVISGCVFKQSGNHWVVARGNVLVGLGGTWSQGNGSNLLLTGNLVINGSFNQQTLEIGNITIVGDNTSISGNGSVAEFGNFIVNKNSNINTLTLNRNITIKANLRLEKGIFDMITFSANNSTSSGQCVFYSNTRLRLGGTNNLLAALNNYSTYVIDETSTIEFYGDSQIISDLPTNLTNGLGNVELTNSGSKIVSNDVWLKGNLINYSPSSLIIGAIHLLKVDKKVINNSLIINSGIIDIGICP